MTWIQTYSGRRFSLTEPSAEDVDIDDVDKALRATFDALTEAGIWRDDKLVAQVTASKVHGVRPGARIHVEPIGGAS